MWQLAPANPCLRMQICSTHRKPEKAEFARYLPVPELEELVCRYFQGTHCSHLLQKCPVQKERVATHRCQSCEQMVIIG